MASTCKCEYCGATISTNNKMCPNCGASNPLYVVDEERIITDPQTIEELQEYCAERGMPLARMRFFIGVDFKDPKAFGKAIIFVALGEGIALYGMLISIMILSKIG